MTDRLHFDTVFNFAQVGIALAVHLRIQLSIKIAQTHCLPKSAVGYQVCWIEQLLLADRYQLNTVPIVVRLRFAPAYIL